MKNKLYEETWYHKVFSKDEWTGITALFIARASKNPTSLLDAMMEYCEIHGISIVKRKKELGLE